MRNKLVASMMFLVLSVSMLTLTFNIQSVKGSGDIYINVDGSVTPATAPINQDGDLYTFTDNIYDRIIVLASDITIDGNGYKLQGPGYWIGIDLTGRNNVTVKNLTITLWHHGVYLQGSSNNSIVGNNITNDYIGVTLYGSSNNTVSGNNITDGTWGVDLLESFNNTVSGNNITDNSYYGVRLLESFNNTFSGNNITNNWNTGVSLYGSSNNTVSGNTITHSLYCVYLIWASNNTVSGNTITYGDYYSISLYGSFNNTVSGNTITWSANHGVYLWGSSNNNTVSGNTITHSRYGSYLSGSSNNTISGNNIIHAWIGFSLWGSSNNNTVSGNNITDNSYYGVYLSMSSYNKFYHNNFKENTYQARVPQTGLANVWDDGYPSGGNYWSDYTGTDADGDGIGDVPYFIPEDNEDRYPLMTPWVPKPATPSEALEELIESIETMNLPIGTEASLIRKLDASLELLDRGNENGAIHKLMDFINQVEGLREKKLTNEQADQLISEAQRIINQIQE